MERYVLTGAPGAGKTSVLRVLEQRGHDVVEEAATAVIEREQARGRPAPLRDPSVIAAIATLQAERQLRAEARPVPIRFFDRSPLCTFALAKFLGHRVPPELEAELDRIGTGRIYRRRVFLVLGQGTVKLTAARRISANDATRFQRLHEAVYTEFGFECVPVPAGPLDERAQLVEEHLPVALRSPAAAALIGADPRGTA
jgi:predicted ATPase